MRTFSPPTAMAVRLIRRARANCFISMFRDYPPLYLPTYRQRLSPVNHDVSSANGHGSANFLLNTASSPVTLLPSSGSVRTDSASYRSRRKEERQHPNLFSFQLQSRKGTDLGSLNCLAGCGGMALGFKDAGFRTVMANEWDRDAWCIRSARNITDRLAF